jgi:hypothetical protein
LYFQIAVISDQELDTHATLAVGYQGSDISQAGSLAAPEAGQLLLTISLAASH